MICAWTVDDKWDKMIHGKNKKTIYENHNKGEIYESITLDLVSWRF